MTYRGVTLGVTALLLAVALAASSARADGEDDFARRGAYVGVGASRSLNLVEAYLDNDPVLDQIEVSDAWGFNARAGYRALSWFAIEAEYEWLDELNVSFGSVDIGSVGTQSATVNLKFIVPTWRFQPYLLLGAGGLFLNVNDNMRMFDISIDGSSFAGRVGVGIDMYLTHNVLVNVGAESILTGAEVKLTTPGGTFTHTGLGGITFQVGLGYRF